MAENGERAGAGAVFFARAVVENPSEEIVVLSHGGKAKLGYCRASTKMEAAVSRSPPIAV